MVGAKEAAEGLWACSILRIIEFFIFFPGLPKQILVDALPRLPREFENWDLA